jgi:hypothetical protein
MRRRDERVVVLFFKSSQLLNPPIVDRRRIRRLGLPLHTGNSDLEAIKRLARVAT